MTYLNQPSKKLLPCPSCPWRVDQQVSAIPNYSHPKACNLLNTVGEGDALRPIMACHGSKPEDLIACKGYLPVSAGPISTFAYYWQCTRLKTQPMLQRHAKPRESNYMRPTPKCWENWR